MLPIRLAIDVTSGDNGPRVILNGILEARGLTADPFVVYLCGDGERIGSLLEELGVSESDRRGRLFIEQCSELVSPGEARSRVWRKRADSAIIHSVVLQKQGKVDASISAGDTGVLLSAAIFILGRHRGVKRPALAAFLPTTGKRHTLLLDVGANLNCRVEHLVGFGLMGYSYVKKFLEISQPKVALLNVGTESTKGTRTLFEAAKLLATRCKGYAGFIEGSGVLQGEADVVVCDGFAGNVLLKTSESFYPLARSLLGKKPELAEAIMNNLDVLNPENYGAVPFLGIRGIVLKAHGSSSQRAFANAILAAINSVKKKALDLALNPGWEGLKLR
jgi:glycerol-3-phosphate acyltransferase PlsX